MNSPRFIILLLFQISSAGLVFDPYGHLELVQTFNTYHRFTHFGYDDTDIDGPELWPGICRDGDSQSPIVLDEVPPSEALTKDKGLQMIGGYKETPPRVHAVNIGHGIVYTLIFPHPNVPEITGGPIGNSIYRLHSFHFHYPCEHESIKHGDKCQFELHLVHFNKEYEGFGNATDHDDGIAVVSVQHEVAKDEEVERKFPFVPLIKNVMKLGMEHDEYENTFSYTDVLGFDEFPQLLSYKGSLTTPPCMESVTWIVMDKLFKISASDMEVITSVEDDPGRIMVHNNRPVQQLNQRKVRKFL